MPVLLFLVCVSYFPGVRRLIGLARLGITEVKSNGVWYCRPITTALLSLGQFKRLPVRFYSGLHYSGNPLSTCGFCTMVLCSVIECRDREWISAGKKQFTTEYGVTVKETCKRKNRCKERKKGFVSADRSLGRLIGVA